LLAANPEFYALACEQGTGKTWMILADAERLWHQGAITGLLVVAPKGVHTNWIRREAPTHLSIPFDGARYIAGAGKMERESWELLMRPAPDRLTIFAVNVDALRTKTGFNLAQKFASQHTCMIVVDESSRIKGFDSERTRRCLALGRWGDSRRILSGTMGSAGPQDLFSQYAFLHPGLLGTDSYKAFVAEYCQLLPQDSRIVQDIKKRAGSRGRFMKPQIIATDSLGRKRYKNLDKLQRLIAPYTYRVKKEDCMDIPEKVFQTVYCELTQKLRAAYVAMEQENRYYDADGNVDTVAALASLNKLRQITSGFIFREGTPELIEEKNPRAEVLMELLSCTESPAIVWAYYQPELTMISRMLVDAGISCVEYHGSIGDEERERAIDAFQNGEVDVFLGQPQSGGIGITLTRARTVVYYSNDFSLENRKQSEDRAHRKGTNHTVTYYDIVATDTKDERIATALQHKEEVLAKILGDDRRE